MALHSWCFNYIMSDDFLSTQNFSSLLLDSAFLKLLKNLLLRNFFDKDYNEFLIQFL